MPPTVADRRILAIAQRGFRREVKPLFADVAARIGDVLRRGADRSGYIPAQNMATVRRSAGAIVDSMFVGYDSISAYSVDGITPLAPYPALLNKWYVYTVGKSVQAHHNWMRRYVPEDVFTWLATRPKRAAIRQMSAADSLGTLRIFAADPLADLPQDKRWVGMHNWQDLRGFELSDRVWDTATTTRTAIDKLIIETIRTGRSADQTAKLLERFLNPDAARLRTKTPYGADGSYAALRLGRTEISRGANLASFISGYLNPYVEGGDWALSPSHPKTDHCDDVATIGMGGERLKAPYPLNSCPIPPDHPHCTCRHQSYMADMADVTARLRDVMNDPDYADFTPVTTPAQWEDLLLQLLGPVLLALFIREFSDN